jgi:arsenite methyltransferase
MAAYVGCIGGAILMDDYREGSVAVGFEHVQIVDSGADLNAYAKVENQAGCCSPDGDRHRPQCHLRVVLYYRSTFHSSRRPY